MCVRGVVTSIPGTSAVSPGVYLVGAGPSSVDFLTLRAFNLIRQADVMIVDDLIGETIKALIPRNCEVITMGKRGGDKNSAPQVVAPSTCRVVRMCWYVKVECIRRQT